MNKLYLGLTLAFLVGCGRPAPSGGQKAYSVSMPAAGTVDEKESSTVDPGFGEIRVFRTVCKYKDAIYAAGQINLPPKLVKAPAKVRQDFFLNAFLKEVNGKLVETRNTQLDTLSGKEYLIDTPTGKARYRLLGTGVQIFRVIYVGSADGAQSKETDAFFDSFQRQEVVK